MAKVFVGMLSSRPFACLAEAWNSTKLIHVGHMLVEGESPSKISGHSTAKPKKDSECTDFFLATLVQDAAFARAISDSPTSSSKSVR